MTLLWEPIPCLEQNGDINYYVAVANHSNTSLTISVTVNDTTATIEGLLPGTYYDIEVYAHTTEDGPPAVLEEGVVTGMGEIFVCQHLSFVSTCKARVDQFKC